MKDYKQTTSYIVTRKGQYTARITGKRGTPPTDKDGQPIRDETNRTGTGHIRRATPLLTEKTDTAQHSTNKKKKRTNQRQDEKHLTQRTERSQLTQKTDITHHEYVGE